MNDLETTLWRDVFLITKRYMQSLIGVDRIHTMDPVRRLSCIADLLDMYRKELKPYALELMQGYDVGPNEWQQRIVAFIFGIEGATNDRAWWGRTLTEWWEEFRHE